MKIASPEKRLASLWGRIDQQHNHLIMAHLRPNTKVLDVGCGYGSLLNEFTGSGFEAEGVDIDTDSIQVAQRLFPGLKITEYKVEDLLPHKRHGYDAIILKDALHHLVGEHDPHSAFAAFEQLLKPGGRLIILDPNPNVVLRLARRIIGHEDPEANVNVARKFLEKYRFEEQGHLYYETIGIALSGGYVGFRLVPNIALMNTLFAWLNHISSKIVVGFGLGPALCWRYLIWADLKS